MKTVNYSIVIPKTEEILDQDEEWLIVDFGETRKRIKLHDYGRIYDVPGLYETIFHQNLKCATPRVICNMLSDTLNESDFSPKDLRVLDFGAGNGVVGEQLKAMGCQTLVGVDILPEAKRAAHRDRTGVYDNYYVMDFNHLVNEQQQELESYDFNCLITVAALGFGDIPPRAFLNAFNLVDNDGWLAFNSRDRFLTAEDDSGYRDIIEEMIDDSFTVHQRKRYCHRLSIQGTKLNYIGIVGRKQRDVRPHDLFPEDVA